MLGAASFSSVFAPRRNSLNAIRLILAVAVIVSHTWPIGGYTGGPDVAGTSLGNWAVAGFFGISGYLITASRFSSRSLVDFLWRRFLRIYPALFVSLLLVGLILAPLSQLFMPSSEFTILKGIRYIVINATVFVRQFDVTGTLQSTPYPKTWNGSLWTIGYEAGCYVFVGLIVTLLRSRRAALWFMSTVLVLGEALNVVLVAQLGGGQGTGSVAIAQLVPIFMAGGVMYLLRDRVPASGWLAMAAAGILAAGVWFAVFPVVAPVPITYLMMWLGARLPLHWIGAKNDISYGMYVYAFPVQQALVLLGLAAVPAPVFALVAIIVMIPIAWASWAYVERPAMRLKSLTARRRTDGEGHVVATIERQAPAPS